MSLGHSLFYPWRGPGCSCRTCGRWLSPGRRICQRCLNILEKQFFDAYLCEHPLLPRVDLRYLIEWEPGESDFLSVLFAALKGKGAPESWFQLAQSFLDRQAGLLLDAQFFAENPHFVGLHAVPSRRPGQDHAALFARALGAHLGFSVRQDLRDVSQSSEQKTRSRMQRLEKLRKARPPRSSVTGHPAEGRPAKGAWAGEPLAERPQSTGRPSAGRHFHILVDDVLTTGATTAELARKLGWPWEKIPADERPGLEVWVLASRSRLAPSGEL